jgi:SAM-dependent methyltransferase
MAGSEQYLLGHSAAEEERLRQQSDHLMADSQWLLDQVGIQPGWRAIDVGCGPRGILDLLADRVGPRGSVVGLERSPATAALAQEFVADRGLANVSVLQGDARATSLPRESFDFVHMRLVLINVPRPEEIIAEVVALARPGGVVAVYEVDWVSHLYEPALPAFPRLMGAFQAHAAAQGIDLNIGRKLPGLLRRAGLVEVKANPTIDLYPPGDPRRSLLLQFVEYVRGGIVGAGLLQDGELNDLLATLRTHLDDPETLVVSNLSVQAWGRKPER